MSDQQIVHTELKRCDLFKLAGRFDSSMAHEVDAALWTAINANRYHFVLDMTAVEYISSGFLRVLVATQKEAKRFNRGDIYLAAPSQRIQDVLKLAGLDAMFKTFATPEEAVGAW
ncbi:MAG: STAS domain-containing protein [Caldilineales bacterium]